MYKTKSRHRNINMKSTINTIATMTTPDFISPLPPHMRVVIPTHKTSSGIPKIILPRDKDSVADSPTQPCLSEHP